MKKPALLPLVLLGACVSDPPPEDGIADREYHRDVARIEAAEEFEEKKEACARTGGAMVVRRTFSRRMPSSRPETSLATCAPGQPGDVF